MESQLRTADRRQLLVGDLSPVQAVALEMLMSLDRLTEVKKDAIDIRLALIPDRHPATVREWFPEWFPKKTMTVQDENEAEQLIEYELGGGSTEFVSGPTAPITPEGVEALIRTLSAGSAGLDSSSDWH